RLGPLVDALIGPPTVEIRFWDGSRVGPRHGPGIVHVRSADAIRRIAWAPGELGAGRAFVAGDIDVEGDVLDVIAALRPAGRRLRSGLRSAPAAFLTARRLGLLDRPPEPPD